VDIEVVDSRLCGQRHRSGLGERDREPGQDGQVGVELDPL
jgi:hypothetical protein